VTLSAPATLDAPERVRVFGGVLASDRPLPGLPVAPIGDGHFALWELVTTERGHAPIGHSADAVLTGRQPYANGIEVTLATAAAGPEIAISDTGRFAFAPIGGRVTHTAPVAVDRDAVALDVIGVVLPFMLHRGGAWCLHASAVQTRQGVVAFIASPGTGKSTLALAMAQRGCALVADDVVVLRATSDGIDVIPSGLPLRLRAETARAAGVPSQTVDAWGKVRIDSAGACDTLPLAAMYVLSPVAATAETERVARTARAAALALLANGKITELLGADASGDALDRCVDIAQRSAVYDLAIPRDLARLPDVTDALLRWHEGAAAP
jgi:predicted ATPase